MFAGQNTAWKHGLFGHFGHFVDLGYEVSFETKKRIGKI